jgi:hypothetical protein
MIMQKKGKSSPQAIGRRVLPAKKKDGCAMKRSGVGAGERACGEATNEGGDDLGRRQRPRV